VSLAFICESKGWCEKRDQLIQPIHLDPTLILPSKNGNIETKSKSEAATYARIFV
jgi:hypothetical protein